MKTHEYTKILEKYLTDDKRLIKLIKLWAVDNQIYELAAQTRSFEKSNFSAEKDEKIIERASEIQKGLLMCDLKVDLKTAYHVDLAMKEIYEKGDMIDLRTGAKIKSKVESNF